MSGAGGAGAAQGGGGGGKADWGQMAQGLTTGITGIVGAVFGWKSAKEMAAAQIAVASEQAGAVRYQAFMNYQSEKARVGADIHQTDSSERIAMKGMELQEKDIRQNQLYQQTLNQLAAWRPLMTVVVHEAEYDHGKEKDTRLS